MKMNECMYALTFPNLCYGDILLCLSLHPWADGMFPSTSFPPKIIAYSVFSLCPKSHIAVLNRIQSGVQYGKQPQSQTNCYFGCNVSLDSIFSPWPLIYILINTNAIWREGLNSQLLLLVKVVSGLRDALCHLRIGRKNKWWHYIAALSWIITHAGSGVGVGVRRRDTADAMSEKSCFLIRWNSSASSYTTCQTTQEQTNHDCYLCRLVMWVLQISFLV